MSKVMGKDTDTGLFDLPGEYVKVERPIKMIDRKTFAPMHVIPGDAITFTYSQEVPVIKPARKALFGLLTLEKEHIEVEKVPRFQRTVDVKRSMAVDTAVILEIKDEFGLEVGCGILIGESKK